MKKNKIVWFTFFLFIFSINSTIKAQSINKLMKTFWVGEKGTMYFINPLSFTLNKEQSILIDFTFNYKDSIEGIVNVNLSVINNKIPIKKINSFNFSAQDLSFDFKDVNLMFQEKTKNNYLIRYSMKIEFIQFVQLLRKNDLKICTDNSEYYLKNKEIKKVEKIKNNLYFLFD